MMQEDKNQMRFPQKLWCLLGLNTEAILWGGTGRTILLNYKILQNYLQCENSVFKTTNISSFVRQLNLYGFRKVTSHLQDPLCNSSNPYMNEYIHDYFQYGRPELLDKITRKVINPKKTIRNKYFYSQQPSVPMTPLQKARQALRIALRKAAQDLYREHTNKSFNFNFECEDSLKAYDEDDRIELKLVVQRDTNNMFRESASREVDSGLLSNNQEATHTNDILQTNIKHEETNEYGLITNYKEELSQQGNESFPTQFLSMPELDPVTPDEVNQEMLKKNSVKNNAHSLNCVLPFVNDYQNDDVGILETNMDNPGNFHGDCWDMFSDMVNKSSNEEVGTEFKELYSQISRSIDLLNP